ncbi:kelch repeat-containing protein [Melittangium boletus]|uniref:High-affinity leucine-specific transport system, periplasmic binding protein LivK n=1 Tax=Melittangium boletus DSM 14713 TaxID=1294270 RepID=A0A250IRL1_9BACT|nr:kelch repeat-containing protein [Melittangium boletus]ATB33890.1 hypothetical protein MEBOL_007391 [Melittangium boletus DSM 14713]
MQRFRSLSLLSLVLVWLAACHSEQNPASPVTGSVQFATSTRQALSASDISRVTVTSSASDMPSLETELARTDGVWGGVIGNIPAGTDRAFLAQAFDSTGNLRFEGHAEGITVAAGEVTLVTLTLQELTPDVPYTNEAPLIDSVVAAPLVVAPGGSVTLAASAHDPNPGDTLRYAWSASEGVFASPSQAGTTWSAPATSGPVTLTLTVSDSLGAASSVSLTVRVSTGEGGAVLDVRFNSRPVVVGFTSTQSALGVGEQTALSVSATDSDSDALSYQWSATCAGFFDNTTSASAIFTPTALPGDACNNCLVNVAVSDGRGGETTATLALCVAPSASLHLPPTLVRSYQSALSARPSQQLTFEVVASDPENSPLAFAWSAPAGTLGTAATAASSSRVSWTAPTCSRDGANLSVTATVTNGFGLSSSRAFSISVAGLPSCTLGSWAATGTMGSPRFWHEATRLNNGKVLVTGGAINRSNTATATAELYDPASGTWTAVPPMASTRMLHRATLLPNGKVLVAGGSNRATAELYDPATNTWSSAGAMASARESHTATLLPNGKVLVAGGMAFSAVHGTAELYDPATNTWSSAGTMAWPHEDHTATLLSNGQVLVAGGSYNTNTSITAAELYDPATNTWSSAAGLLTPRRGHTATLLPSGKVLIAGGFNGQYFPSVDVYEPATNTWSSTAAMASARGSHTATLLPSGKVLVSGGYNYSGYLSVAEVYDPATQTWVTTAAMNSGRESSVATMLNNGQVLVSGGVASSGVHASAELYTP